MDDNENISNKEFRVFEEEVAKFIDGCWDSVYANDQLDFDQMNRIKYFTSKLNDYGVMKLDFYENCQSYLKYLTYFKEGKFYEKDEKFNEWVDFKLGRMI